MLKTSLELFGVIKPADSESEVKKAKTEILLELNKINSKLDKLSESVKMSSCGNKIISLKKHLAYLTDKILYIENHKKKSNFICEDQENCNNSINNNEPLTADNFHI